MYNALSALSFLVGGLLAYALSFNIDISFLIPFAAGNFIYIGASDLVPEVKENESLDVNILNFLAFISGLALMLVIKVTLGS
jgi:zinc and cadmium transporter